MEIPNSWPDSVAVVNPRAVKQARLPAEHIPIGIAGDYKPCIARLPDGELLLVFFRMHTVPGPHPFWGDKADEYYHEKICLCRSGDDGLTWSEPQVLPLLGREPYFSILSDGTILITVHLLGGDIRNEAGYCRAYVHRSTDGGATWQTTEFAAEDLPGWHASKPICSSRNVLEMNDGTLFFAVGSDYGVGHTFRSPDKGQTWQRDKACVLEHLDSNKASDFFHPFWETVFWQAPNDDILALYRCASKILPPIQGCPVPDEKSDHFSRLVLFRSTDGGQYWSLAELGSHYGEMYPAILRLKDGRFLLTFTVRAAVPPAEPPLGVRAVFGRETANGIVFDFDHDRVMLDTKTPLGKTSGGGFGCTVQTADGTLVTSYSYKGEDDEFYCEVVRWRLE